MIMSSEIIPIDEMPSLNISVGQEIKRKELTQASAENIDNVYTEIISDIRKSGEQIDEVTTCFINMVINDGDASSSSKEAVVNLLKIKSDLADKKIKAMELMMRSYLKETNTFPKYLAAHQHNKITIEGSKRELLQNLREESKNEQT